LPTTLLPVTDLRTAPLAQRRTIVFSQEPQPVGAALYSIDGKQFDADRVDYTVRLNTVEEWVVRNDAPEVHPLHMHVNPFQVISINGAPHDGPEYHDTFDIPPNGEFVMRVHFADYVGKFVFHCHIGFHEDAGMMLTLEVVP
jgi:suppressor of ftsI